MRLALLAPLLLIAGCGSHHHADAPAPPAIDHRFDRLVGSWSAVVSGSGGDYIANTPGSTAMFTVDSHGHLSGFGSGGGTVEVDLTPASATRFTGSRLLTNGRTEIITLTLTPEAASDVGVMDDGHGSVDWNLTPISAPG